MRVSGLLDPRSRVWACSRQDLLYRLFGRMRDALVEVEPCSIIGYHGAERELPNKSRSFTSVA